MSKMENDEARIRDAFYNTCDALNQQAKPESLKEQWWFEAGYKAALQQAKPKQGVGDYNAWLIEQRDSNGKPTWLSHYGFTTFTDNAWDALHFSRKQDAEHFADSDGSDYVLYITEHSFPSTTQPIPVEPKQAQVGVDDTRCSDCPCRYGIHCKSKLRAKLEANQALLRVASKALEEAKPHVRTYASSRAARRKIDEALKQIGEV